MGKYAYTVAALTWFFGFFSHSYTRSAANPRFLGVGHNFFLSDKITSPGSTLCSYLRVNQNPLANAIFVHGNRRFFYQLYLNFVEKLRFCAASQNFLREEDIFKAVSIIMYLAVLRKNTEAANP